MLFVQYVSFVRLDICFL